MVSRKTSSTSRNVHPMHPMNPTPVDEYIHDIEDARESTLKTTPTTGTSTNIVIMNRSVSHFWSEKARILIDAFQLYGLIWHVMATSWPKTWLYRSSWTLLFNLDGLEFWKFYFSFSSLNQQTTLRNVFTNDANANANHWHHVIALGWIFFFSLLVFGRLFLVLIKKFNKHHHLVQEPVWSMDTQTKLLTCLQWLYLPILLALGRLDQQPVNLWSWSCLPAIVFGLAVPLWLHRVKTYAVGVYPDNLTLERFLIRKEMEYLCGFNEDYVELQLSVVSSFQRHGVDHGLYQCLIKFVTWGLTFLGTSSEQLEQLSNVETKGLGICLFSIWIWGFYRSILSRPYRCSSSNTLASIVDMTMVLNSFYIMVCVTNVRSSFTLPHSVTFALTFVNNAGACVTLCFASRWFLLSHSWISDLVGVVGHFRVCRCWWKKKKKNVPRTANDPPPRLEGGYAPLENKVPRGLVLLPTTTGLSKNDHHHYSSMSTTNEQDVELMSGVPGGWPVQSNMRALVWYSSSIQKWKDACDRGQATLFRAWKASREIQPCKALRVSRLEVQSCLSEASALGHPLETHLRSLVECLLTVERQAYASSLVVLQEGEEDIQNRLSSSWFSQPGTSVPESQDSKNRQRMTRKVKMAFQLATKRAQVVPAQDSATWTTTKPHHEYSISFLEQVQYRKDPRPTTTTTHPESHCQSIDWTLSIKDIERDVWVTCRGYEYIPATNVIHIRFPGFRDSSDALQIQEDTAEEAYGLVDVRQTFTSEAQLMLLRCASSHTLSWFHQIQQQLKHQMKVNHTLRLEQLRRDQLSHLETRTRASRSTIESYLSSSSTTSSKALGNQLEVIQLEWKDMIQEWELSFARTHDGKQPAVQDQRAIQSWYEQYQECRKLNQRLVKSKTTVKVRT